MERGRKCGDEQHTKSKGEVTNRKQERARARARARARRTSTLRGEGGSVVVTM